ncbi:hypothetical protein AAC387_Pa01g1533 [Persea americana]
MTTTRSPPVPVAMVAPLPSAPPEPDQFGPSIATGIPINSMSQFCSPNAPTPPPIQVQPQAPVPWSTGLCDCCDDVYSCCITCWCPCITFGQIAEIVDRGSSSCAVSGALYMLLLCVTGCSCLYSCFYRSKMRGQYFLEETPCADCLVHCCCEPCAMCQEYRELKSRGFDLSIGWKGNLEKQNRGLTLPPAIEGGMRR